MEAAKQERQELDKEKREKNEAWSKMIGEEDFSEDKGIIRLKKEFCCACRILKNLIFFKPKKAEGTFFVETFVKSILYLVFLVLQLGCSIIIILQLLGGIMTVWQWYPKGWSGNVMIEAVIPIIFNLIVIFCSCVLFKLFSIIKYEVKKIDDGNFSFSFLATLLAVVSLVTPLLASLLAILLAGVPLARPLLAFFEGGI